MRLLREQFKTHDKWKHCQLKLIIASATKAWKLESLKKCSACCTSLQTGVQNEQRSNADYSRHI